MRLYKFALIAFFSLTFICACNNKPENFLDEDKMISLNKDIRLLEAYLYKSFFQVYDTDSVGKDTRAYYETLFEKHNTTYNIYKENVEYYLEHNPIKLEKITKSVAKDLRDSANNIKGNS